MISHAAVLEVPAGAAVRAGPMVLTILEHILATQDPAGLLYPPVQDRRGGRADLPDRLSALLLPLQGQSLHGVRTPADRLDHPAGPLVQGRRGDRADLLGLPSARLPLQGRLHGVHQEDLLDLQADHPGRPDQDRRGDLDRADLRDHLVQNRPGDLLLVIQGQINRPGNRQIPVK